jgi:putative FmdB family regulatory protein
MPIYEYECRDCRRVVSLLVMRPGGAATPVCPRCGGSALTRLMSRFATPKSEEARMEALADSSSFGDLDENDPASVARVMKRMGRELGEDLGDDFESAIDEAMEESPDSASADEGGATSDSVSSETPDS